MANLNRFQTAQELISGVAVEAGLGFNDAPFAANDPIYRQIIRLLNIAGNELIQLYAWQQMIRNFDLTTQAGDTGDYALPTDFAYMIDQTHWNRTDRTPMGGPLSPQQWEYLKGWGTIETVIVQFMQQAGKFRVLPQPPPVGVNLNYDYMSRGWVIPSQQPNEVADNVSQPGDIVKYEPMLISRLLKYRLLQAKGFDTTKAEEEWNGALAAWTGYDKGAPILNLNGAAGPFRYLDGNNLPVSGYGV